MYDNYSYPMGADNPRAPWNIPDVPEEDFNITCSQSLSRTAVVTTNNYIPVVEDEPHNRIHEEYADTSDTCWKTEYDENGYTTPLQLIGMLKEYLEKDLRNIQKDMLPNDRSYKVTEARRLKFLIEECDAWNDDETEFCEG